MNIEINDEKLAEAEIIEKMNEAAVLCLAHEGVEPENVEISLSFVDEEEIRAINKDFRNNDSVTDVLSFPQFDDFEDINELENIFLGDVVICSARAKQQAQEYGHSIEREMVYLFVHSMFHLLGYDHMEDEDKAEMRKAEEEIMTSLEIER